MIKGEMLMINLIYIINILLFSITINYFIFYKLLNNYELL